MVEFLNKCGAEYKTLQQNRSSGMETVVVPTSEQRPNSSSAAHGGNTAVTMSMNECVGDRVDCILFSRVVICLCDRVHCAYVLLLILVILPVSFFSLTFLYLITGKQQWVAQHIVQSNLYVTVYFTRITYNACRMKYCLGPSVRPSVRPMPHVQTNAYISSHLFDRLLGINSNFVSPSAVTKFQR